MVTWQEPIGVGLGYRRQIERQILEHAAEIDFLELFTENCFSAGSRPDYERVAQVFPVVMHGLKLSIGTAQPLQESYLADLVPALRRFKPIWFSDHLAVSQVDNIDIGQLTPISFSEDMVKLVVDKLRLLQKITKIPFLLENITYYFSIPGAEMEEAEWLSRILNGADCYMLLDVNNLFINSVNHDYDSYEFLQAIPMERVVEVHIGGARKDGTRYIDSHADPVLPDVWDLLEYVCANCPVKGVVLERDENLADFGEILAELRRARGLLQRR